MSELKISPELLQISPEVQDALKNKKPVVALESTIISHGMPFPQNAQTAIEVEETIRKQGAVPATIAIIGGVMKVGLSKEEIEEALNERHSPEKQKLLSQGQVTIAGLGGLGSNVAYSLARIGVGHLHLIDFDVVDITNLNRQQYFMEHIGMYKTDALKSLLLKINPYLDIRTDCVKVTEENLKELFADAQIVCEAFDNPVAKAMLVNGILEHFPEKKLVSATGMAGYESSNIISTKRMMKNFYLCGDRVTEPTYGNGLMAPRVAICAGHEANMITRLLLGEEDV